MATRVTATEVKEIIDTDLADSIVETFITPANQIVTDAVGSNTSLSDAQRKEIERWLTAHLLAVTRVRQTEKEGVADASVTFQGKTAMGLDASQYGQQVKLLDTTGTIAQSLGKRGATIRAVTSFD